MSNINSDIGSKILSEWTLNHDVLFFRYAEAVHRNESCGERYNFKFMFLQVYIASEIVLFYLVPLYILNFILSEIFLNFNSNNV